MHGSSKTFEHAFSCAFRQHRATHSHCSLLHGYAISVRMDFEAITLDSRNWVVDFGGLKELKGIFETQFDHTVVVAKDDPHLDWFREGEKRGILELMEVDAVGMEKLAELIFKQTEEWLGLKDLSRRVTLKKVEVWEHSANSAWYTR